ncbi:hypothetical protein ABZ470_39925 [Streptosporangium sp. NPDC020072]|uniref:hypothetical protein n=1 Tax=Streptosporangium sp. NPDC020072 TaxID=3154788 RepID=UPI00341766F7
MTTLQIVLLTIGGLSLYSVGFAAAVRVLLTFDAKHHFLGEHEDWMIASVWPLALLVASIVGPFALLYRFTTRDLR